MRCPAIGRIARIPCIGLRDDRVGCRPGGSGRPVQPTCSRPGADLQPLAVPGDVRQFADRWIHLHCGEPADRQIVVHMLHRPTFRSDRIEGLQSSSTRVADGCGQPSWRAITPLASSVANLSSSEANARVSSAFSRSNCPASTRCLSRRTISRIYSLTFSQLPSSPLAGRALQSGFPILVSRWKSFHPARERPAGAVASKTLGARI